MFEYFDEYMYFFSLLDEAETLYLCSYIYSSKDIEDSANLIKNFTERVENGLEKLLSYDSINLEYEFINNLNKFKKNEILYLEFVLRKLKPIAVTFFKVNQIDYDLVLLPKKEQKKVIHDNRANDRDCNICYLAYHNKKYGNDEKELLNIPSLYISYCLRNYDYLISMIQSYCIKLGINFLSIMSKNNIPISWTYKSIDTPALTIPKELDTPRAKELLNKAVEYSLLADSYKWDIGLMTKRELAYFCYVLSNKLELSSIRDTNNEGYFKTYWKPFKQLFNEDKLNNNLRGITEEDELTETMERIKEIYNF